MGELPQNIYMHILHTYRVELCELLRAPAPGNTHLLIQVEEALNGEPAPSVFMWVHAESLPRELRGRLVREQTAVILHHYDMFVII